MAAEQTLAEVTKLRHAARARAHGGAWLPAAVVAALLLASIALYRYPFGQSYSITAEYPFWAGLADEQRSPMASYVFWFVGVPLLFVTTAAWYRWRERHLGMRVAWRWFASAGLGALLVLAVLAAAPKGQPGDGMGSLSGMFWLGVLTPLLPVGVGVVALGVAERSRGLVASGVWIAVLALWLCSAFPLGSVPGWVTWLLQGGHGPAYGGTLSLRPGHYLVLMALPLLVFAALLLVRGRRTPL